MDDLPRQACGIALAVGGFVSIIFLGVLGIQAIDNPLALAGIPGIGTVFVGVLTTIAVPVGISANHKGKERIEAVKATESQKEGV